ncbi:glutamate--cysteine ligase [Coxiella burnetii]|uniref:glutamate--cysteine ligase n=1 Tax=Coxiella burnetii TaxID=777 RepID=UPI000CCC9919|nr:glutamate--cysteine ligase [Coxiella burnetii]PNT86945.1 glutamate--cysteine ligase [Coxiella burnetii]
MSHNPSELNEITLPINPLNSLEKLFFQHQVDIESWFRKQWLKTPPPFYTSVDLRNAGFKIAPVDTNLFPAGFNNLNPDYMPLYIQAVQATIAEICPDVTRLLLVPESHSRNIYYLESLGALTEILKKAGFEVRIGSLDESQKEPRTHELPSGQQLLIEPLLRKGDQVGVKDFFPCCVILNNDLSGSIPDIFQNVNQWIMPAPQLGWAMRLKSGHFRAYAEVAEEFAAMIDIDPWLISPLFDQCPEVNFLKKEGEECLVKRVQGVLRAIKKKYDQYHIEEDPFLAVKADAGTYGMAVMMIQEAETLRHLNRKQRTRMSTSKGGVPVTKAIVQEGVYTFETAGEGNAVAEPVVYLFGRHVIGGFYRIHRGRGPNENLNSPGMDFIPMAFDFACNAPSFSDNKSVNRFYIYGVIARLAALATARELLLLKGAKGENKF